MENPTSPIASNPTKAITIGALRFTIELHPPSDGVMNPEVLREWMWEPTETRLFLTFVGAPRWFWTSARTSAGTA